LKRKLGNVCINNSRDTNSGQALLHERLTYLTVSVHSYVGGDRVRLT